MKSEFRVLLAAVLTLLYITIFFSASCSAEAPRPFHFSVSRSGGPYLDPHAVQGDLELHLNPNIFEGLLKIEADTGKLIPCLATSYSWVTPEIVEFELRKNVHFHNGEIFDAQAVQYSFKRMAAVKNGFNWIRAILPEFKKVEIVNPHTVRIHLHQHSSIFLISSRFFVILPPKYLREKGVEYFLKHPVGTGPFAVEKIEYDKGTVKTVYLHKNTEYWNSKQPKLDQLVFHFGLNQRESLKLLLQGKLDGMGDLPIRRILDAKKAGLDVRKKGQGLLSWLYFNLSKYKRHEPVWAPEVRKAIMHAIDYNRIRRIVYRNRAVQNNQWAFPGLPGYDEHLKNYDYNPVKAKELLKKAGYENGFHLSAYCDDVSLDEAKIVKSSLKRIGIKVTFDILDEQTNNCFLTSRKNPDSPCHPLLKKYDFMIGDFGWGLPHNYVSHIHTFSLDSFVSMVAEDYPGAKDTVKLFNRARHSFGEDAAEAWRKITAYEFDRLSVAGLMLKNTYFAVPKDLSWEVYGAYDFSKAEYR